MKIKLLIVGVLVMVIGVTAALSFQPSLESIHKVIENDHQSVSHISADEYQHLDQNNVIVFDVRAANEFSVSHIEGAIQLSPHLDVDQFSEDYAGLLHGKIAVFYCSVGRRSSDMLARLSTSLEQAGVQSSANLTGGIFNWVNQKKVLVGENVHPYNAYWGRLIQDQSKVAYSKNTESKRD